MVEVKRHRNMLYSILSFYFSAIWFVFCYTESVEDLLPEKDVLSDEQIDEFLENDVVKFIEAFEEVAQRARESVEKVSEEDPNNLYDEMTEIVQGIIDLNSHPNNNYKFLRENGLGRVVSPNLRIAHAPLRRALLMLTKQTFDISPSTAKTMIPPSTLDNVLEIFEHDNSLTAKAYALDVLSVWLPGNPKIQARVMRLKGLDPFYDQISKLDFPVIQNLLELFNKVLDEHIAARGEGKAAFSVQERTLYQQIGLIERMSTGRVCDGILNIFEKALPVLPTSSAIAPSMFELVEKIQPFCVKPYKGKKKPLKVFTDLLEFFNDAKNEKQFVDQDVDVSAIRGILENYVYELKQHVRIKDEL